MKNLALVSALLAGTVAAVSPRAPLVARQESIPCAEIEVPVTCCSDGYTYCNIGEYCTTNGGCCPVGEVCSGPGGTDTHIITSTDFITNTFTVPDTPTPTEPPVDSSEAPSMPSAPSSSTPGVTVPEVPTSSPSDVVPPVPTQSLGAAPNVVPQGSVLGLLSGLAAFLI